jgi:hypothetical protein
LKNLAVFRGEGRDGTSQKGLDLVGKIPRPCEGSLPPNRAQSWGASHRKILNWALKRHELGGDVSLGQANNSGTIDRASPSLGFRGYRVLRAVKRLEVMFAGWHG